MADGTQIEWTDATWNPITGCSLVSPGCTNCYAMRLAGSRLANHPSRAGLTRETKAGPVWTGDVRFNDAWLDQPLRWAKPRMIFVCAHGDLFAEGVPDAWIDLVFAVMALAPQHTFQVLTKRAGRMRDYLANPRTPGRIARVLIDRVLIMRNWPYPGDDCWPAKSIGDIDDPEDVTVAMPLPNVWLGVSAEDQRRADERVPILLQTPAAVRWVSAEPLLGMIRFDRISLGTSAATFYDDPSISKVEFTINALAGVQSFKWPALDWIVAGGESGNGARPMHPDWVRQIRNDCATAGVAFLFKQWGAFAPEGRNAERWLWSPDGSCRPDPLPEGIGRHARDGFSVSYRVGKKAAGRFLDGVTHDDFPAVSA